MMVSRNKRDVAANLLEEFRTGKITSDELENNFPSDRNDPALGSIYERLWFCWDSRKNRKFDMEAKGKEEIDSLFRRCVAFLRSDLEYCGQSWGRERASFGLGLLRLFRLNKQAQKVADSRSACLHEGEDSRIWPFHTEQEFAKHLPNS
jgi:hypothetical protein